MNRRKKFKKKESELLTFIEKEEKLKEKELKKKLENFSFADFVRTVVGILVFAGSVYFTPDFWDFIVTVPLYKIFIVHLVYIVCIFVTLNYDYRHTFNFDTVFLSKLLKRTFYIYVTVLGVVILLLWALNKLTPDITTFEVLRFIFSSHSVGMTGAITFQFIAD